MRSVLALFLLVFATANPAAAMSYRTVPIDDGRCGRERACPTAIQAVGEIGPDELDRFLGHFLENRARLGASPLLVIHSPGGSTGASFLLAFAARKLRVKVVAGRVADGEIGPGVCASACVYVLMGGVRRAAAPGTLVAVHQPYRLTGASLFSAGKPSALSEETTEKFERILTRFTAVMGVDRRLVPIVMSVPHTERRVLTASELRRLRVTTEGARR